MDLWERRHQYRLPFPDPQASEEAVEALRSGDARRVAAAGSDDTGDGGGVVAGASPHVFASLHYLRKLCSQPVMVMDLALPAHCAAVATVLGTHEPAGVEAVLRRLKHAPELVALRDLLTTCGIIAPTADDSDGVQANSCLLVYEGEVLSGRSVPHAYDFITYACIMHIPLRQA